MDGLGDVSAFIQSLDTSIEKLQTALKPALSTRLEELAADCSSPQERIKLYQAHLYTLISVLYSYLKSLGVKTEQHPIMKELTRIKESMKTLKELESSIANRNEQNEKTTNASNEFLRRTLGTTGGMAATDNLKSPAISSANFKGVHTKFEDDEQQPTAVSKSKTKTQRKSSSKVTKPRKA